MIDNYYQQETAKEVIDNLQTCVCMMFKIKKARIEDISIPPIGGMIPLKIFRYGSVIVLKADNIPLLQSIPGNHVNKTLIIKIVE